MTKNIPLVVYDKDGNRHVVGDADVLDDGTVKCYITDKITAQALNVFKAGEFSIAIDSKVE